MKNRPVGKMFSVITLFTVLVTLGLNAKSNVISQKHNFENRPNPKQICQTAMDKYNKLSRSSGTLNNMDAVIYYLAVDKNECYDCAVLQNVLILLSNIFFERPNAVSKIFKGYKLSADNMATILTVTPWSYVDHPCRQDVLYGHRIYILKRTVNAPHRNYVIKEMRRARLNVHDVCISKSN